ncbi:MAG: patatin-like phospholipase family protein [Polyangiaceae bacterium]|nr:patatin-like phospholipase family protein [Polyangiaceae bacterium]
MTDTAEPPRSTPSPGRAPSRKVALILSGGGARGAYEVGVLSYVLDDFARLRKKPPKVDILCGTSIGAINACYLAAHLAEPTFGVRRLVNLWTELNIDSVLGFSMKQALTLPRVLLGGGSDAVGLFDVTPMARLIEREIPWRAIARTLRHGHLSALSVSATEVASGRTVIFMQTGPDGTLPTKAPPRTVIRGTLIGPLHALASAAIPFLFPPVRIGTELFMDGGIRQNTPISPALRLGATHVFAVGLSREVRGLESGGENAAPPSATLILGKILNALLLDHVTHDLEVLTRVNQLLVDGERAFGDGFMDKLNTIAKDRDVLYRRAEKMVVRPSEDIGRLAGAYVRGGKLKGSRSLVRRLLSLVDMGQASEADLASYLLFDGDFARKLVELGRADAEAKRADIAAFFGSAEEQGPPKASDREDWIIPAPVT